MWTKSVEMCTRPWYLARCSSNGELLILCCVVNGADIANSARQRRWGFDDQLTGGRCEHKLSDDLLSSNILNRLDMLRSRKQTRPRQYNHLPTSNQSSKGCCVDGIWRGDCAGGVAPGDASGDGIDACVDVERRVRNYCGFVLNVHRHVVDNSV